MNFLKIQNRTFFQFLCSSRCSKYILGKLRRIIFRNYLTFSYTLFTLIRRKSKLQEKSNLSASLSRESIPVSTNADLFTPPSPCF